MVARVRSRAVSVVDGLPGAHVAEVQRVRLLAGAVRAVDELGYDGATVAEITLRARVSRRTFYDLFSNREDCLLAVLDSTVERVGTDLAQAGLSGLAWRERVRCGLELILGFFDREPQLARVCVVQAARGSGRILERREQILTSLARVLDEGRAENGRGGDCPPLTAEGLVGAAVSIIYARLLRGDSDSLTALTGELMGLIVLPYLGPAAARREQTRPAPAVGARAGLSESAVVAQSDPLRGIPMRVTYRTMRVLEVVARQPGLSNRALREQAGISDEGQTSKLLARLQRLGLLQNSGEGHAKGEPNAWILTPTGVQVEHSIRAHTNDHERTAA
jgi:AcrR family transcriptional regulator